MARACNNAGSATTTSSTGQARLASRITSYNVCYTKLLRLETLPKPSEEQAQAPKVEFKWDDYHKEQLAKADAPVWDDEDDDDWDDEDDTGVEVIYTR